MGLKECNITFDNQWNVYYAGQTVNGRVDIILDSTKKVRSVTICFKGEANTRFMVEETRTNNEGKQENETVELTGSEEYFKIQYYLIGGPGGNEIELSPGTHTYPFTCALPPTLPSSFEGEYGHIRYTVKVTLDRPWKFDQEGKAAFSVISPVDLNMNQHLKNPVRVTMEKYFCCCWCKSGPLTCVLSIPCSGYVSGQTIPITAELDNISNVEILNVNFALQKVVTYHSQVPRREVKKEEIVIAELQVGPVAAHASNTWNQPLVLPPLPPSNLTNCSLIDLDYELKIEVCVGGLHQNLKSKIPLTIGTIPFTDISNPSAPPLTTASGDTEINIEGDKPQLGWNTTNTLYPNLEPPTFVESQFKTNSIQDKSDSQYVIFSNNKQEYSPVYPVYSQTNHT